MLIYSAVESLAQHKRVRRFFERRVLSGELTCAVTFPVLLEFIHITTDPKRFLHPLTVAESLAIVEQYWNAEDWIRLLPEEETGTRVFAMLRRHRLGRKRLLDTYFAATLLDHGITHLITCDLADFRLFPELRLINPLK